MRNKILYISTENLNFFYRLNKELNRLNIKFEILNLRIKNPIIHSLILTTSKEAPKFKNSSEKLRVLPYSEENHFHYYILKVLAAYRVGYKEYYSELIFSIDPGTKQIGVVIFLDDFFLISHTFYDKKDFIEFIKDIINYFQDDNPNLMILKFKFGRGVLPLTFELLKNIFVLFNSKKKMKFYLIDESKSSKTKIKDKKKRVKTKHELSALILSLRKGIEVNQSNYLRIFKQNKLQGSNYIGDNNKNLGEFNNPIINLQELINKILNNEMSLSEASEILYENIRD